MGRRKVSKNASSPKEREENCPTSASNGVDELTLKDHDYDDEFDIPLASAFPLKRKRQRPKKIDSIAIVAEEDDGHSPLKRKRQRPKKIDSTAIVAVEDDGHSNSSDVDWNPIEDKDGRSKTQVSSQVMVLGEVGNAKRKRGKPKVVKNEECGASSSPSSVDGLPLKRKLGTLEKKKQLCDASPTSSYVDETHLKKKPGRKKKIDSQAKPHVRVLEEGGTDLPIYSGFDSIVERNEPQVFEFDYDVESHFETVRIISVLSGVNGEENIEARSIDRFNASMTFLKFWKDFSYKPKKLKFSYGSTDSEKREISGELELPPFSSASLPVNDGRGDKTTLSGSRKDFVLHAGGPVWALDWCPCVDQRTDQHVKCEYLAIAAHPPESSYHKMGAVFSGRGLIQIWCILNVLMDESLLLLPAKRRGSQANRSCSINGNSPNTKEVDVLPSTFNESTGGNGAAHAMGKDFGDSKFVTEAGLFNINGDKQKVLRNNEKSSVQSARHQMKSCFLSEPVLSPKLVLGLAHNGKVIWDAKWKPCFSEEPQDKCRMGYLAVLLGNGSLEVWEVPSLITVKSIYELDRKKDTDPRFIKLEPVFQCSQIKRGDLQSVPLTLEWSAAVPHDLILVGFHDGTVALWKFSVDGCGKETRPLLCFTADNVPIRTLAWAPNERNTESSNVIVTGGHDGLRFWDIRDPYRPLRDLNRLRKDVLSMSWLCDPGCIFIAFDDGNLKILSLSKSANDTPLTGKPCSGTYLQGLHEYCLSTFAIWNVHASSLTGLVAYCTSDGCTFYFKLPRKAVEKDASRNRAPLFLCGSLTEEESTLVMATNSDTPLPMKTQMCTPKPIQSIRGEANMSVAESDTLTDKVRSRTASNDKKGKKKSSEIVVLPPKIVAMHRVRWNMNKGSERWLSYGGAAGLVRCQEINNQMLKSSK